MKKYIGLYIVLLISLFSVLPLFHAGFFPMHDDTQIARVFEMGKSLKDGMFPVRWLSDLGYGYGYPLFNFYAPLAYYIGGFLILLGLDALIATKIMMGIGILLASVFMYLFAKEFFGKTGAIVSALLYMYAPYHAVDIYVRGDVAEFFAYAFIPLLFYALWMIYATRQFKYVLIGALGFAAVILSHNLTAFMLVPFLFLTTGLYVFFLLWEKDRKTIVNLLLTFILGLLLSAFYFLPALMEMKYTNILSQVGGGADFRDHFVCIQQLWASNWGYGGSVSGCTDGLSFKIGKLHILLFLFSLFLVFAKNHISSKKKSFLVLFYIFAFFSVLLTLSISKPLWEAIKPMAFIQYPWRFLSLISFFVSFLAGGSVFLSQILARKIKVSLNIEIVGGVIIILLLLFFNTKLFVPQDFFQAASSNFTNEIALKWNASKTSDEFMPPQFSKPLTQKGIIKNKAWIIEDLDGKIVRLKEKTQYVHVSLVATKSVYLVFNTAYFPFWIPYIDSLPVTSIGSSLYVVQVPKGQHTIELLVKETPIEKSANVLSIVGIFMFITGIIYSRNKMYYGKKT